LRSTLRDGASLRHPSGAADFIGSAQAGSAQRGPLHPVPSFGHTPSDPMRDLSRDPTPQPGDVVHQPGHPLDGFTVISVYTRAQAIADGVLADATTGDLAEVSAQHFLRVHVAMTAAVFALIEQAVAHPQHANDWRGVWHDILWMSRVAPLRSFPGGRLFKVVITGTGRKRLHTLKALVHPDEAGRPCLTIMLPDED
jgi:hypothetical protein